MSDKFPISIKAVIIDGNRVLCLKNERNEWDLPGGKINFAEDVEESLKNEVKEETNLNIKNLNVLTPLNLKFNNVYVFVLIYSAEIAYDSPVIISHEHHEYNFFSRSEVENLSMPKEYKNIIEKMFEINN